MEDWKKRRVLTTLGKRWKEAFWKLLLNKAKKGERRVNLVTERLFRCGLAAALSFVALGMTPVTAQGAVSDETFIDLCENGTVENVHRLIRNGANVNARNNTISEKYSMTALMAAAKNPNPGVVKVLLENGADVNAKNKDGETALMSAAMVSSDPEVVKVLLAGGADVNARDDKDLTALILGVANNSNPEVVKVLLAGEADVRDMDDDGRNAIWHARHNKTDNREKIIRILEGY